MHRYAIVLLFSALAFGQCTTDSRGVCNLGLPAAQDNLLGPLIPYGASPWTFGDVAEKGVADNMAVAALAAPPALGTALSGTVSFSGSGATVTTTADLTGPLSGQSWVAFAWNSSDGAGTGRALCPIQSVTASTIVCAANIFTGAFSGITAYLLPAADIHGNSFLSWTASSPAVSWNYYDVGIGLYRLYYRTGNSVYQTYARQYADITWQWTIDHGYNYPSPRAASMVSQFFRALDGHSERFAGLYAETAKLATLWGSPAASPNIDNREAGYTLWDIALGAKTDPDATRHASYCSMLTTYVPQWVTAQNANGSWPEHEYALNPSYVDAPNSFTPPFLYEGSAWREAINLRSMEAAYEVMLDTGAAGCNQTAIAASALTAITNAVTWTINYGRDTSNRGTYYEVSSQSNDQQTVYNPAGTVSINTSSTALVGVGTGWQGAGYCDGTHFIGIQDPRTIYKIASCADNTHATLSIAFGLYGEGSNVSGSLYSIAPAAIGVCHSSAVWCFDGTGDRNLTRTYCGAIGWLYGKTLNNTYLGFLNECLSATLGGPSSGLTSAANIGTFVTPCAGPACDGYVNDMVASAATCGSPPCIPGAYPYANLGKNWGEAFGAPGIDNGLAYRLYGTTYSACDLNHDNVNNVLDVQLVVNMSLSIIPCTANINGNGVCDATTIQRTVNAALGGACVVGP